MTRKEALVVAVAALILGWLFLLVRAPFFALGFFVVSNVLCLHLIFTEPPTRHS